MLGSMNTTWVIDGRPHRLLVTNLDVSASFDIHADQQLV